MASIGVPGEEPGGWMIGVPRVRWPLGARNGVLLLPRIGVVGVGAPEVCVVSQ